MRWFPIAADPAIRPLFSEAAILSNDDMATGEMPFVDVSQSLVHQGSDFQTSDLFSERSPALGTKGDLMLLSPQLYLIKDGSGPIAASSLFRTTNDGQVVKGLLSEWSFFVSCSLLWE